MDNAATLSCNINLNIMYIIVLLYMSTFNNYPDRLVDYYKSNCDGITNSRKDSLKSKLGVNFYCRCPLHLIMQVNTFSVRHLTSRLVSQDSNFKKMLNIDFNFQFVIIGTS